MENDHWNLIDTPLSAGEEDLLGISKYVDGLVSFLKCAQMPTTLAIQGEWGSGKTSLMNQLRYQLCTSTRENAEKKPYYGVWINTWQYSLLRDDQDIIIHVIEGITSEVIKIVKSKNSFLANEALHKLGACFRSVARIGAHAAATAVGMNANAVDELLNQQSSSSDPFVFRDSFETSIKNCLLADHEKGLSTRGFLFFVDDLDRIDPQLAVKILEIVKNLFEVENCIFILAIDYEVVVKGLAPKFGKMTEENEREYRSFFDKIVQLPFKMPIETYNIKEYLSSSLQKIQFFTAEEMESSITTVMDNEDHSSTVTQVSTVSDLARDMVAYSAGTNPRSIKRLLNTLSLIRIMYVNDLQQDRTPAKQLIFLGLICLQISYPSIYKLLMFNPEFYNWDDEFAQERRLKAIDEETYKQISEMEEFDEDWEQILYRACIGNPFLIKKAFHISKLLNCIKSISFEDKEVDLGELIGYYLGIASITSVADDTTPVIEKNTSRREEICYKIYSTINQKYRDNIGKLASKTKEPWGKGYYNLYPDNERMLAFCTMVALREGKIYVEMKLQGHRGKAYYKKAFDKLKEKYGDKYDVYDPERRCMIRKVFDVDFSNKEELDTVPDRVFDYISDFNRIFYEYKK